MVLDGSCAVTVFVGRRLRSTPIGGPPLAEASARAAQSVAIILNCELLFVSLSQDILKAHRLFFYNQNLDTFDTGEEFKYDARAVLRRGHFFNLHLWAVQSLDLWVE